MKRLLFFLLLLLVAGCARPDLPLVPLPSAADLLQQLYQAHGGYRSLDAEAEVGVTVDGKYLPSTQFLLLERPDRMRIDALTGFGQLILQLSMGHNELAVFLNTEVPGRFYRGSASDANLWRFTRLPLKRELLVRLLLYDPQLIPLKNAIVEPHPQGALLRINGSGTRQDVVFDHRLRPVEVRYYDQDQLTLEVSYDKFSAEREFPQVIRLDLPLQEVKAVVKFADVRLNEDIPDRRFQLDPPKNAIFERLPD